MRAPFCSDRRRRRRGYRRCVDFETCRLVLVRHGATASTDVIGGHRGCGGLSPEGHAQATALAERLARDTGLGAVAAVYSSVMRRAVETAEPLAAAVGAQDVVQDCDLSELHDGEADGLTVDQAIERWWRPASLTSTRMPW